MRKQGRKKEGHKNRRGMRLAAGALAAALCFGMTPPVPVHADTIKDLQNQISEEKEKREDAQNQKDQTEDNINSLSGARDSLQGQLNGLTQDLTQISAKLEEIEQNIIDKNAEIEETQKKLAQAKETEQEQYAAMKKRLRFLYMDNNRTYYEILFNAKSFSELLNQSTYIEKLHEYDRRMLLTYQAQREAIEEMEAKLEQEKADLDGLQAQAEEQKSNIMASVNQTQSGISAYSGQIADAQAQADALEAQIAAQDENIAALQKQLQEEIAKSRLAARSTWRDISEVTFAEGDRYLLANLIYCEAGNQPYEGQVAVGSVVINRVLSSVFPNTVSGVIYQYKQFAPVLDGHLALALAENRATASCYKAADEAMAGYSNVGHCVYFRTPIPGLTGMQIGDHIFY